MLFFSARQQQQSKLTRAIWADDGGELFQRSYRDLPTIGLEVVHLDELQEGGIHG